ncbi:MAG: DUF1800 domain-containing protein [Brevundimonas sp.]|uniref:DUF1800 domain-containing protein n=1 Tax=Brevundimonas sp. TaxID=1871086 RepID=UPI0027352782|nr:DUF1800 domain-containing protein [Brevundimonas sp.]MDP3405237.1 DUF1800 domain-containing protein [Brevundimonas sp.]
MSEHSLFTRARRIALPVALLVGLASCGGGGGGGGDGNSGGGGGPTPPPVAVISDAEAAKFLTQATFGPTDAEIEAVKAQGYGAWINAQIALPSASHQVYVENRLAQIRLTNPQAILSPNQFYESFWLYSATGQAQLRERMKLALSEIFVISMTDANIDVRGAASYYDMLGANAFGNYRTLLEQVSLHPMMGIYLTHLANQREDPATARTPDENYAREVMQLMSIGVQELNPDGTVRRNAQGEPIPTYTPADISNLAKVFTGFSWYHPTPTNQTFFGRNRDVDAAVRPMIVYPQHHSITAKTFLGVTIPAGNNDASADLRIALDTIFNNVNVPPFICKQLIQRLVTSNPSGGYVSRCSSAFANNGAGVRGDLAAVVRTILTDAEARDINAANSATFGKIREPMIRMTNWMRAFGATSVSGNYLLNSTSANTSLGQSALASPSVFNFFRPGYVPPNTRAGAQNLTVPEFQIVDEVTVAGYANTMQAAIGNGIGMGADVRSAYVREVAIANDANALADRMNRMLLYGQMSSTLRARIVESVNSVAIPAATGTNQAAIDTALLNRARLAVYMTMVSPEYLVQR